VLLLVVSLSCQHTGKFIREDQSVFGNVAVGNESQISPDNDNLSPDIQSEPDLPDQIGQNSQDYFPVDSSIDQQDYSIDVKNNIFKLAVWEEIKYSSNIHLLKSTQRQTLPGYFVNHPQSNNSNSAENFSQQASSNDTNRSQFQSSPHDSTANFPSSDPATNVLPSLSLNLHQTISSCVQQYIVGVVNNYTLIEYLPGDSLTPLTISPAPRCTVPSYARFDILPGPDSKKVVLFLNPSDSIVYDFSTQGGILEIPDADFNYNPVRMEIRTPQLTEVFNFVLYSERWIEVFCDYDIQCAVMWDGARPRIWTLVTTGKSNWTRAEHCRIMNKEPVAYFVLDRSPMRWWMGIQNVHGTQNGTHAPLSGTWWKLGRQGSHGCIRNPFAERFYQLMEVGDRVEVYYRHNQGFDITEINPAWRYLRFDLLEEIEDSSDLKQYVDRASEILIPIYQEKLNDAWLEDSSRTDQTAEYQSSFD
jgi:hypothetical protein